MHKLIFLLIYMFTLSTWAQDPVWIGKHNYEDINTYYFIESTEADRLNEPYAREEVRLQATQEAIRQVVGTESNLTTNTVATDKSEYVATINNELFPQIDLKNFTEKEMFTKGNKVYFLYAWPKSDAQAAIEKAKTAIKVSKNALKQSSQKNTQVTISSEPSGAEVFIDGLRWGTTPLTLSKKIDFGKHKFMIEHKRYKTIEFEDVVIVTDKYIHRVLEPVELEINFTTNPSGARIIIDGEYKGTTPITIPFIVTDDNYKKSVTIEHELAVTQTLILELDKNTSRTNHIEMLFKGTKVILNGCAPSPCNYSLGKFSGEINNEAKIIYLPPGNQVVTFSKLGYIARQLAIEIEPGVEFQLETIHLDQIEQKKMTIDHRMNFQLGIAFAGGDFPFDKYISCFGFDTNLSAIVAEYLIFTAGGSLFSYEDNKNPTPAYKAKATQSYYGAGFNIANVRLLFLAKKKKWEIENNYPHKIKVYRFEQRAIKLDMPVSQYSRWYLEYNEFEDFKVKSRTENGFGIGIGLEF
ncbi:hypothetical protein CIK05_11875 [Bdellovibrio sp. qaytius]|nr:hypothetical protein CIK05_11875 [Bdellovibrio sp. qaytius]